MVAMLSRVPKDYQTMILHVVVVDVEARTVVKLLVDELILKFGSDIHCGVSPELVPNNKSFIVFGGVKDSSWTYFLYDLQEEKLIKELTDLNFLEKALGENEDIRPRNCILLDDDIILSAHEDKLMRVWSTKDGSLLKRVAGHRPRVYGHRSNYISMYYSPRSQFILTCESDMTSTIRLWEKKSFLQLSSLTLEKKVKFHINIRRCAA
ncbi:unnamed protein product [Mytilus edulis]|uniref:Uncharacterized protein n=1 Tax=Mytilus edulis TaxID=6550 RepID=A0A8S3VAJ2_MYTED|nr:unnamed protein product [Mytilus edulis]